ncbi:MAG: Stp1/IreP family PP2C-type Ser/Thr phosphatase [Eubacteriales bacterium]
MECAGKTDKGMKRKSNQDSFRIYMRKPKTQKHYCAAVVCDGMGGAKGGSTASKTASSVFMKTLKDAMSCQAAAKLKTYTRRFLEKALINSLMAANRAVYEKAATSETLEGMGTTLVAFVRAGEKTLVINTGDSRLYASKGDQAEQVTKDHSFVQYLVDTGTITQEEAENHPQKNIILKVVGVNEHVEFDLFLVEDYDCLLLCTDGVSNLLSSDEVSGVLAGELDPAAKAEIFINLANQRGGADNVTAVVFKK